MNNKIFYRLLTVLSIFITSVASADTYKNLPAHLLTKAISTDVVYDEDFDYTKLKKTHEIPFGPFLAVAAAIIFLLKIDINQILNFLTIF